MQTKDLKEEQIWTHDFHELMSELRIGKIRRSLIEDFIDHAIQSAIEEERKELIEKIKSKLNWKPKFKGEDEEEVGFQKGIIAEDNLIKDFLSELSKKEE